MSVNAFIGGNPEECLSVCGVSGGLAPKCLSLHNWCANSSFLTNQALVAIFASCKQSLLALPFGVCIGWNERLLTGCQTHHVFWWQDGTITKIVSKNGLVWKEIQHRGTLDPLIQYIMHTILIALSVLANSISISNTSYTFKRCLSVRLCPAVSNTTGYRITYQQLLIPYVL